MFSPQLTPILKSSLKGVEAAKESIEHEATKAKQEVKDAVKACQTEEKSNPVRQGEKCEVEAVETASFIKSELKQKVREDVKAVLEDSGLDHAARENELAVVLKATKEEAVKNMVVQTLNLLPGMLLLTPLLYVEETAQMTEKQRENVLSINSIYEKIRSEIPQALMDKTYKGIEKDFKQIVQVELEKIASKVDTTPRHIAQQLADDQANLPVDIEVELIESWTRIERQGDRIEQFPGSFSKETRTKISELHVLSYEIRGHHQDERMRNLNPYRADPASTVKTMQEDQQSVERNTGRPSSDASDAIKMAQEQTRDIDTRKKFLDTIVEQYTKIVSEEDRSLSEAELEKRIPIVIDTATTEIDQARANGDEVDVHRMAEISAQCLTDEFGLSEKAHARAIAEVEPLMAKRMSDLQNFQKLVDSFYVSLFTEIYLFLINLQLQEEQKSFERQKEIDIERDELVRDEVKRDVLRQSIRGSEVARENSKERVKVRDVHRTHHEREENQYRLAQDRYREEEFDRLESFRRKIFETDRSS